MTFHVTGNSDSPHAAPVNIDPGYNDVGLTSRVINLALLNDEGDVIDTQKVPENTLSISAPVSFREIIYVPL